MADAWGGAWSNTFGNSWGAELLIITAKRVELQPKQPNRLARSHSIRQSNISKGKR